MGEIDLEEAVRSHCERREFQSAAVLILESLGADVMRVLHARLRNADDSAEVFSRFVEAFWIALPDFEFRCSVRAWVFTLARNAGHRFLERERKRARHSVSLEDAPALAAQVRSVTLAHQRSSNRDRVTALRDELAEPDQLLLTLRIHHGLSFREIAHVLLGQTDGDEQRVAREAARLRKRFQLVKDELRARLRAEKASDDE